MAKGTKHPDVEGFLVLYRKLVSYCDDEPSHLIEMAQEDSSTEKLCHDLWFLAHSLERAEDPSAVRYAKTVDPAFIKAWRSYQDRFSPILASIMLADLISSWEVDAPLEKKSRFEIEFDYASDQAKEAAAGVKLIMDFAQDQLNQDWRTFSEEFEAHAQSGLDEWSRLTRSMKFDLEGVFRRRELVPFVLIPRHVSDAYGNEILSLFSRLRDAHEAFIYGAFLASLALLRAILETVIVQHYGGQGPDLEAKINSAKIPSMVPKSVLHRLRRNANAVVHGETKSPDDLKNLEKEILGYLYHLRSLIEAAPTSSARR